MRSMAIEHIFVEAEQAYQQAVISKNAAKINETKGILKMLDYSENEIAALRVKARQQGKSH
jgi:predicted acetyltransferase